MRFYTISRSSTAPANAKKPYATLTYDPWDDYGYKTLYNLEFVPSQGGKRTIGAVKIASTDDEPRTKFDSSFPSLGDEYFSLGQSMSYYQEIRKLPKTIQREMLLGLRDIVYQPSIRDKVSNLDVYITSLTRFSEAAKVLREAPQLFGDEVPIDQTPCSFQFSVKLKESAAPHTISVVLGNKPKVPDRMMALIGKNGTGKTWLLGRLAAALSGDEVKVGKFVPERPAFQKVIAVSYSAFDRFNKPNGKRTFSYCYCGIYDADGKLHNRKKLLLSLRESAKLITEFDRQKQWEEMIESILNQSVMKAMRKYLFVSRTNEGSTAPPKLSSGQLVLISTITALLAVIENESMVLFDEPELHQHPNAVAGLINTLNNILKEYDSYAILATHSPLVIQQIPSEYVRVFTRTDNATVIRPPVNECFGENLTTLTQEVFQVNSSPSLYREWLREAITKFDDDELLQLFPNGLSFHAASVLESMK
jgi:ABC-type lipoprotein export system ATPase subunit